ncbi:MAG: hypothetical protein IH991_02650 [Planctomycetes bacterium]|nr:hypothetical protein [Planctomycetota bacterium]
MPLEPVGSEITSSGSREARPPLPDVEVAVDDDILVDRSDQRRAVRASVGEDADLIGAGREAQHLVPGTGGDIGLAGEVERRRVVRHRQDAIELQLE